MLIKAYAFDYVNYRIGFRGHVKPLFLKILIGTSTHLEMNYLILKFSSSGNEAKRDSSTQHAISPKFDLSN